MVFWKRQPAHEFHIKNHAFRNVPCDVPRGTNTVAVNKVANPFRGEDRTVNSTFASLAPAKNSRSDGFGSL